MERKSVVVRIFITVNAGSREKVKGGKGKKTVKEKKTNYLEIWDNMLRI